MEIQDQKERMDTLMDEDERVLPVSLEEAIETFETAGWYAPEQMFIGVYRPIPDKTRSGVLIPDGAKQNLAFERYMSGILVYDIGDKTSDEYGIEVGDYILTGHASMNPNNALFMMMTNGLIIQSFYVNEVVICRHGDAVLSSSIEETKDPE